MSSMFAAVAVPQSSPHHAGAAPATRPRLLLQASAQSHQGLVRERNEDAFVVAPQQGLYGVADGMGGAAAGDVASRMAIDTVRDVLADPDVTCPQGLVPRPAARSLAQLVNAVEHANARIFASAFGNRAMKGMGSTFTGLLVLEDRLAIAHVGDSRAYLFREGSLVQLTRDHTLLEELIRRGIMTREQAAVSDRRHILSRALGAEATVIVDGRLVAPQRGDIFLLASDGLHGVVSDEETAAALLAEPDLTRASTRLIERACDAGGPDNVTVVLLRVG